jgi:hypothetical protein
MEIKQKNRTGSEDRQLLVVSIRRQSRPTSRLARLPAQLKTAQSFANSVTEKNRPLNLLRFVEPIFFFYLAPMQWSSHLVPHS